MDTNTQLLEMAARLAGLGHWHYHLPSGRIVWSDEIYRIHGFDQSQAAPDYGALMKLYEPECAARLSALVERAIATGGSYEFEGVIRRPDGAVRNVAAKAQCRLNADGKVEELFGVFQDVTEQTRATRFMRTIADSLPAMVAYWDTGFRCRYSNLQYREWFGRTAEEMDGIPVQQLMGAELFAKNEPYLRRAMDGEAQTFERTLMNPLGNVTHMLARYIPDRDADGRVLGMLALLMDVTVLKETELHLKEANDIARTAARTAEEALRAKQAFLASVSHELRNPLTGVIGFSELMSREGRLDARAAEQLVHIQAASRTLLRTIDDLLSISRLDAGQFVIEPGPTDPRAIAAEMLQFHAPQIGDKNLTAELSARGLPAVVMMDAGRVRQILTNFITNAAKFTAEGGITLRVAYDEARELISFEVQDTGCGIAPEHHAKIFKRFSQVDGSLNRRQAGTGLGLSICKGLAEAMGGEVSFESRVNEGSCFRIALPAPRVAAPPEQERELAEDTAVEPLRGFRILVVDDHQMNRMLVRQMLEPFEVEVVDTGSAQEAVGIAALRAFDLILLDLMMPSIDGVAAVPMIRACPANGSTPIIAFSAMSESDLTSENAALFSGLLTKPIIARDLLELLLRFVPGRDLSAGGKRDN